MVKVIFKNRGKPSSALVQFYDSRDLYELDWAASPYPLTLAVDAQSEPALLATYDSHEARDHSVLGFVYRFFHSTSWSQPSLLLQDVDRDGVLDLRTLLDGATLNSSGYSAHHVHEIVCASSSSGPAGAFRGASGPEPTLSVP